MVVDRLYGVGLRVALPHLFGPELDCLFIDWDDLSFGFGYQGLGGVDEWPHLVLVLDGGCCLKEVFRNVRNLGIRCRRWDPWWRADA